MKLESEKVDNATDTEDESPQDGSMYDFCVAITTLFLVLSIICAFIAVFILSIYFLVLDHGKGGVCAETYGQHIWVYFLVRLIVGCCSQVLSGGFARINQKRNEEGATEERDSSGSLAECTSKN